MLCSNRERSESLRWERAAWDWAVLERISFRFTPISNNNWANRFQSAGSALEPGARAGFQRLGFLSLQEIPGD